MNESKVKSLKVLLESAKRLEGGYFSEREMERFLLYYEMVLKWNSRLHLTTIVEPAHFFQRHLFESDFAASLLLPSIEQVWDMGTGLGVPGLPIAVLRSDLMVKLVEAKRGKAIFLEEVVSSLKLRNVAVINARIESLEKLPANSCLTARAVEQMKTLIPEMIRIGGDCSQMIFFGSSQIGHRIQGNLAAGFQQKIYPVPQAETQIFSLERST